jgi:putative protein-disulfide isomerase
VKTPILWYFADPMCSWCWGFSPVIDALRNHYRERVPIALVLGGLRPGTTTPLTSAARDEILHHWRAVNAGTGQPFRFDDALPPGFVYDSEPPSRAVLAVGSIDAGLTFAYFKAVQSAFYAEGRDVTQADVLASLANDDVDAATFRARFDSEAMRAKTLPISPMPDARACAAFPR